MTLLHANALAMQQGTVLLSGPSGSGKSSLTAHLLGAHNATLIADDRVELSVVQNRLVVAPTDRLTGLLEVRGLGVIHVPTFPPAQLDLVIELVARKDVPRVAEPRYFEAEGVSVPLIALHAFDRGTPFAIKAALEVLPKAGFSENGQYGSNEPEDFAK